MRFGKALKSRFELIRETPIRILAIVIAVIVSLCYGLVTVIAFSEMPDSVRDFPVAIVNDDEGAELAGKPVNYGDMIMEEVEKNDSVKWEECDQGQLENGIEKTDYYFAFIIPEDFSEKVLSAKMGKPETAWKRRLTAVKRSLALLFIVPLRRKNDVQLNSPEIVFFGYVTMALFSVLEAVLVVTGVLAIGIEPVSAPQMYFFAVVMALSFSAILQCFNLAFGIGGNIVSVLITIFMIPACSGSFPVDLMPGFFSKISRFLPMTYSIDGIREALSVGNLSTLLGDCAHLCVFLIVFMCLSLIICKPSTKRVDHITEQINRR